MDWTQDVAFEFITLYEDEPVLWDPNHPDRNDKTIVNKAWFRIKRKISVDCTVVELKMRKEALATSFKSLWTKIKDCSSCQDDKPTWIAFEKMERFWGVTDVAKDTSNPETAEKSKTANEEKVVEISPPESSPVNENNETQNDEPGNSDVGAKETNEIEPLPVPANPNDDSGIDKDVNNNESPSNEAKKNKRKGKDLDTPYRSQEAIDVVDPTQNVQRLKTSMCASYGTLVAERLSALSEADGIIVMNEIDNIFYRAKMASLFPEYQAAFYPKFASPVGSSSPISSSDETPLSTPTRTSSSTPKPPVEEASTSSVAPLRVYMGPRGRTPKIRRKL